ncbi:hypothetical protein QJQ45_012571 [Haematococcus lacustris]|nr:hypothetical protein QJQ45_012571 [Haematococcus lacustris]
MQLSQLRMQADETVARFFAKTMLLRDELTSAGCPPSNHSLMLAVLNAMPPEFKIAIKLLRPVSSQQQSRSSRPVCQYCNYPGHVLSECRRYARDHGSFATPASPRLATAEATAPAGAGGMVQAAGAQTQQAAAGSSSQMLRHLVPENMTYEEFLDFYSRMPRWVIDSGANRHIMPWRSCLSDYRAFDPPIQLQLGGEGSFIDVLGEGTTFLTNSKGEQWAITGVLHAPAAAYCYLSVFELTHASVTLRFHGDHCDLIGRGNPHEWQMTIRKAPPGVYLWHIRAVAEGRRVMGYGNHEDDTHLYDPDNIYNPVPHALRMQPNELDPQVWHQRCGHASFSVLTRMQREGMVEGVPVSRAAFAETASSVAVCPGCAMGKQHRRVHFDLSTNAQPVTSALGLVHMDVCGPMPHVGRDGSRYIATFLDEHTGLSVIQLLPSKDQVPAAIQRVITELETQSGHRCKALRSDNGSEYSNKTIRDWCSSKGIQQQFSAPYCPEQNGKAERLNRTIMQATRSMLLSAQLPPGFWVDAALKANYPNLSALRVFGATAWVYVTQPNRNKLQPKAVKGVFLGYAVGSKAYKLWVNGRQVISKDVQIDETAVLDHHRSMQLPVQSPVPNVPAPAPAPPPPSPSSQLPLPLPAPTPTPSAPPSPPSPSPPSPQSPQSPASPQRLPLQQQQSQYQQPAPQQQVPQHQLPQQQLPQPQLPGQSSPSPSRHSARAAGGEASSSTSSSAAASSGSDAANSNGGVNSGAPQAPRYGAIEKFKARLVAKGFMQVSGVDVGDVYAPVSKHTTLRALLALAAARDMEVHQIDVEAAFLNGTLQHDEVIHVQQPEGFEEGSPNTVCRLQKALYGLRQAPRAWHAKLKQELEGMGFCASESDPALFMLSRPAGTVYLLVYVDDCLLCTEKGDIKSLDFVKQRLSSVFGIKDLGQTRWFLGMQISRDRSQGTLQLDQQQYIKELLSTYSMTEAHSKAVPMAPGTKLVKEGDALDTAHHSYSALVGSLLYLSCCTRPDIAYAVGALARHMAAPTQQHWAAAKAVLSYLKGTASQGLVFGGNDSLQGYFDANYAGDKDTARSTTGYVFTLHGAAISWSSRLQHTVAMSSAEAEYMAASGAVKEAVWLRKLMQDLGLPGSCVNIMCDNQAALQLLNNPMASARSKHISVHHHFARERAARGEVMFTYCSTSEMAADVMTKPLAAVKLGYAKEGCGISCM